MQATVDDRGRFMEYSLRPGACSDKNVWKMSSIGRRVHVTLPHNHHMIGDAGYTLATYLLTPFEIFSGMPADEKRYNYLHSRTRITVECAFGMLKGRWRILKRALNMKTPGSCARTIISCLVLHNLTINAADDVNIVDRVDPWIGYHNNQGPLSYAGFSDRAAALQKRDNMKDYLSTLDQ